VTIKKGYKMKKKLAKKNQSVEKAFQIIEYMAKSKGALRLHDIAVGVGLPESTALRFLNTMLNFGYVTQNPESLKYSLTMKFCWLGGLVRAQASFTDIVRPYLEELAEKCEESACIAVEQDMSVVYIDVVDGPDNMLKTLQRIGHIAPMHSTGVGKIMLLDYDEAKLDKLIKEKSLISLTKNTITTKEKLLEELERVRKLGYAMDNEECEIGAKCIAAPIRDYTGKIVAGVSISGPATRMTPEKIEKIKNIIVETTNKISRDLGYFPD